MENKFSSSPVYQLFLGITGLYSCFPGVSFQNPLQFAVNIVTRFSSCRAQDGVECSQWEPGMRTSKWYFVKIRMWTIVWCLQTELGEVCPVAHQSRISSSGDLLFPDFKPPELQVISALIIAVIQMNRGRPRIQASHILLTRPGRQLAAPGLPTEISILNSH